MAKPNNQSIPKDDYDLGKALGDVVKVSTKTIEGRKNSAKRIGSDQSTNTSIGEFNITINNNTASSDNQPQTIGLTESDVDAKIQNFELRYTKSQQEFQSEISDKLSGFKDELNKKMPKGFWIPFAGAIVAVLLYFLNRYDKLQDKETEIIIKEANIVNRIESVEQDIIDIKEYISPEREITPIFKDTLDNKR